MALIDSLSDYYIFVHNNIFLPSKLIDVLIFLRLCHEKAHEWNQNIYASFNRFIEGGFYPQLRRWFEARYENKTKFKCKPVFQKWYSVKYELIFQHGVGQIIHLAMPSAIHDQICFRHISHLIPAWISNYMPRKVFDEITYPFLNFNGCTVEV